MKTCPKCRYERKNTDYKVPEWQCPSCGVAYAKFEEQQSSDWAAKRAGPAPTLSTVPPASQMSATALFFIVAGLVAAGYAGYRYLHAPKAADGGPGVTQAVGGSGSLPPVLQMSSEASEGLSQLTTSKVVFFSTSWCPHCKVVRSILQKQGVRFTEFDVERDERAAAYQKEKLPVVGFPVTIIGNQIVMGDDEGQLLAALKTL